MRYFERERLAWIEETLRVFGFINRAHLMIKFDISMPQASKDLQTFQKLNPGALHYDTSSKFYRRQRKPHGN